MEPVDVQGRILSDDLIAGEREVGAVSKCVGVRGELEKRARWVLQV